MKNFIVFLLIILVVHNVNAGLSFTGKDKQIIVETNYNIETIAICFEIADNGFWNTPFSDYQPMKALARKRFEKYRNHNAIQTINSFVNKGFWLDAMAEVLLKCTPLPHAELRYELEQSTLSRLSNNNKEALGLINEFLKSLNQFYIEAKLSDYFIENKNYFDSVNNEVKQNIPDKRFISTLENYYGEQNESYTLIPVPTLWRTLGFGLRLKGNPGFKVYNLFGPMTVTKDSITFGFGYNRADKIDEFAVHEFGHSFINPITNLPENEKIIDSYEYLFEPIKEKMSEQGYVNWQICVSEHLVRLGEIRISYVLGDSLRADRIRKDYVNERGFIYITDLEKCIKEYEKNRRNYHSINEFMPILLKSFSQNF